ncbi:hypothetical protein C6P43_003854 [Kluyveromyces marxianus]|nr:hypothetical protein C6P43_003854 [Kluyveromyces marxianus]
MTPEGPSGPSDPSNPSDGIVTSYLTGSDGETTGTTEVPEPTTGYATTVTSGSSTFVTTMTPPSNPNGGSPTTIQQYTPSGYSGEPTASVFEGAAPSVGSGRFISTVLPLVFAAFML